MYYNRFRYYAPEEGMYIRQDPIRLEGSNPNFYAYVSDSNSWIDPLGLDCISSHTTPFKPLSPKRKKALKNKKKNRTITKEEYKHLEWDRRFSNRRSRGVSRFWSKERKALKQGGGRFKKLGCYSKSRYPVRKNT